MAEDERKKLAGVWQGLSALGTTKDEQTRRMCDEFRLELANLRQIADRKDGSPETGKALKDIQTLALLLDGDSEMLDYLIKIRDSARQNPTD